MKLKSGYKYSVKLKHPVDYNNKVSEDNLMIGTYDGSLDKFHCGFWIDNNMGYIFHNDIIVIEEIY